MNYLSIGAMFKDEASCIEEWLQHYIKRGVDHFYLINDNSTDNFLEVLSPYSKLITLFNFQKTDHIYSPGGRQAIAYNRYFKPFLNQNEWFLICDIDEYVWSPKNFCLKKEVEIIENKCDLICLHGQNFGSNNHELQPINIVNSFTKRQVHSSDKEFIIKNNITTILNMMHKEMIRSTAVEFFGIHQHKLKTMRKGIIEIKDTPLNNRHFRFNHYMTQSKNRWVKNLNKTDVSSLKTSPRRSLEQFYILNQDYNQIDDFDLIKQNDLRGSGGIRTHGGV